VSSRTVFADPIDLLRREIGGIRELFGESIDKLSVSRLRVELVGRPVASFRPIQLRCPASAADGYCQSCESESKSLEKSTPGYTCCRIAWSSFLRWPLIILLFPQPSMQTAVSPRHGSFTSLKRSIRRLFLNITRYIGISITPAMMPMAHRLAAFVQVLRFLHRAARRGITPRRRGRATAVRRQERRLARRARRRVRPARAGRRIGSGSRGQCPIGRRSRAFSPAG
jgi:hypothetical protein